MTTTQPITLEDFLSRQDRDDAQREELIEGELVLSPEPKPLHSEIINRLQSALTPIEKLGFVVRGGFSCILGSGSAPGPDLAAIDQERWWAAIRASEYLAGAPELVIEVRSPSNRQLGRKASLYLQYGAEQVWVVYPQRRAIVVYDQDGVREIRQHEQLEFRGVSLDLRRIFEG
jgi:Uma2 family endonuclease